jgi:hypothetical protein
MCLFSSFALFGQTPQMFNYQATVRNSGGEIQTNIIANFEVEILQNGTSIYSEQHLGLNTGLIGVVNFKIGEGTAPTSDFSQIDWSIGGLQVKVNLNGDPMGISDIVAVPFALYAEKSGDDDDWLTSGDSIVYTLQKRIGIGTSNPDFSLQVEGEKIRLNGNEGPSFEVNTPSSSILSPEFRFAIDGERKGTVQLRRDPNFLLLWENLSSGPTTMVLKDGRVGVNTLSPSDQFHVRGILRVQGIDTHQKIRLYSSSSTLDNRITSGSPAKFTY